MFGVFIGIFAVLQLGITARAQSSCPTLPYNKTYYDGLPYPNYGIPSYVLFAPAGLRLNVPYQVTVALLNDIPNPADITATLYREEYFDGNTRYFELAKHKISATKKNINTITLTISEKLPNYPRLSLNVVSTGGLVFNETKSVQYLSKNHSTFIQTDKGIYQPSETVRFRIFVVDRDMKPYTPATPIVIKIYDNQNNLIKQWQPESLTMGIFQEELQLSDRPNLGSWRLSANTDGMDKSVYFSVEEYVLPTSEVSIVTPSSVTWNDTDIPVTITSRYTFDKPVEGTVELFARRQCYSYNDYYDKNCDYNMTKTGTLNNGKIEFQLPILRFKASNETLEYLYVTIKANVTETATGKTQTKSTSVSVVKEGFQITIETNENNFIPGNPIKFKAIVKNQANEIANKYDAPLIVNYAGLIRKYSYHSGDFKNQSFELSKDGAVDVTIPTSERDEFILVKCNYKGFTTTKSFSRFPSQTGKYINIKIINPKETVLPGDIVELQVDGTYTIEKLFYTIIGRSQVLASSTAETQNSKTIKFKVTIIREMAPTSNVIVYSITPCGEIVANFVQLKVQNLMKTPVSVSASPNETDVGKAVNIVVKTNPEAWVGVHAVDKSVLLLKSGNDITENAVTSEINSYNYNGGVMIRFLPVDPDPSISQIFTESGTIFSSNSPYIDADFFNSYRCPVYYRYNSKFGGVAFESTAGSTPAYDEAEEMMESDVRSGIATRKSFPQTWFWLSGTAGANGSAQFSTKVPDTITTWVITPIAMDKNTGLGVTDGRGKVLAYRPFFVNLNLPYSVVRGEKLELKCIVFNYLKEDAKTDVTLSKTMDDFVFIDENGKVLTNVQNQTKTVTVKADKTLTVSFLIQPTIVGSAVFKVSAISNLAGDIIEKQLLIKAEGSPLYFNIPLFVDLRKAGSPPFASSIKINVPDKGVKDSERIECGVIGDSVGSSLDNIEHLIRQPYGCGEQNMIYLVPNIMILDYLSAVKRLTSEIRNKAILYVEKGYQQQLGFRRSDGSYSAFGSKDPQGSTWLTAYVVKSFIQAINYITVDYSVIDRAANFLMSRQNINASFLEMGYVFNKRLEGGASKSTTGLTAYVVIALLKYKELYHKTEKPSDLDKKAIQINNAINVAITKLEKDLATIKDVYVLSIVAYALHLADSKSKDTAFNKLKAFATTKGGQIYWEVDVSNIDPYIYYGIPADNVETTAYALLTYLLRSGVENEQLSIFRWLVEHRNPYGGYSTTQATVMAIEAISKMAVKIYPDENTKIDATFQYLNNGKVEFKVDKTNYMYLQSKVIEKKAREVAVSAKGQGFAIAQCSWSYNVLVVEDTSAFNLTSEITVNTTNYFQNRICAQYNDVNGSDSGMAIIEFYFPTGYVADPENIPQLSGTLQFLSQKNKGTLLELYYSKLTNKETCVTVTGQRQFFAQNLAKSVVRVYSYYAPEKRRTILYSI